MSQGRCNGTLDEGGTPKDYVTRESTSPRRGRKMSHRGSWVEEVSEGTGGVDVDPGRRRCEGGGGAGGWVHSEEI